MTLTATTTVQTHRPFAVGLISGLLALLGLGAVGGGGAMIFGIGGKSMLPDEYLGMLPIVDSWLVPGLLLGVGFGFGSLVLLYGMLYKPNWPWLRGLERLTGHHWAWIGTIAIGVAHMAWIAIELISIPFSFLMPTFGLVALALALLPWRPSVRAYLRVDRSLGQ
jgi:hypothetical protein